MRIFVIFEEIFYLGQGVEHLVEVHQDLPLDDFGDIVHALTCIVAYAGILVGEAGEDRRDDFFEVGDYGLKSARPSASPTEHLYYAPNIPARGQ